MSHRVKNMRKTVGRERNNSCPCGSGLKFKRCCGKHLFVKVATAYNLPAPVKKPIKKTKSQMIAEAYNVGDFYKFMSKIERMALRGW